MQSYTSQTCHFESMSMVFFGPDIKQGIGLSMIAELRRIGGDYQSQVLAIRTLEEMNRALSQVFRVEAKIPSRVHLNEVSYYYTAPLLMKEAIKTKDLEKIKAILAKGMSIKTIIHDGLDCLNYAKTMSEDNIELMVLLSTPEKIVEIATNQHDSKEARIFYRENDFFDKLHFLRTRNKEGSITAMAIKNDFPSLKPAANNQFFFFLGSEKTLIDNKSLNIE